MPLIEEVAFDDSSPPDSADGSDGMAFPEDVSAQEEAVLSQEQELAFDNISLVR